MDRAPIARGLAALPIVLALAACGGGGGGGGSLTTDLGVLTADYVVVDLATGEVETRTTIGDLATSDSWRTGSRMVFKAVQAGSCSIGSPMGQFGRQADETLTSSSVAKYYLGVFEVTQAQWQLIAGTRPWDDVDPLAIAGGASAVADDLPAFAISLDMASDAVTAWNGGRTARLALPSAAQWENACRAGASTAYAWGDERDEATVGQYATVFETLGGADRPRVVGSRSANGFGFYDMHGNVWEWTSTGATSGAVRGGSWSDPLSAARSANKADVDTVVPHALVGVRLVLIP